MDFSYPSLKEMLFKHRLDPALKKMMTIKKTQRLSVIIQSVEGIDERIKKCIRNHGGKIVQHFPFCKACYALLTPPGIKKLETLGQIYYLSPNRPVTTHLNNLTDIMGDGNTAHGLSLTGRDINVALLDTGTYPHPDLIRPVNRILYFKDFINHRDRCYDDNGHGTFIAGIIGGNGFMSKDKYTGIAPGAGLISLKVLNESGNGWTSTVLAAMQWVYDNYEKFKISLACLPFGCVNTLSADTEPLSRAAQKLWELGIIVCTSAGNNGPDLSWVSSPGINPNIITIGALQRAVSPGGSLAPFSSRGLTHDGISRPDFVAPGTNIISLNFKGEPSSYTALHPSDSRSVGYYYRRGSGTSAACAAVTGLICLLLERYGHLSPGEIKSLLKYSCKSLNLPKVQQGHGLPNMYKILDKKKG